MNTPVVFDGRDCYSLEEAEGVNVDYYSVGRKAVLNYKESMKAEIASTVK